MPPINNINGYLKSCTAEEAIANANRSVPSPTPAQIQRSAQKTVSIKSFFQPSTENGNGKSNGKSATKSIEQPAAKGNGESATKITEKRAAKSNDKFATKSTQRPAAKSTQKSATNSTQRPAAKGTQLSSKKRKEPDDTPDDTIDLTLESDAEPTDDARQSKRLRRSQHSSLSESALAGKFDIDDVATSSAAIPSASASPASTLLPSASPVSALPTSASPVSISAAPGDELEDDPDPTLSLTDIELAAVQEHLANLYPLAKKDLRPTSTAELFYSITIRALVVMAELNPKDFLSLTTTYDAERLASLMLALLDKPAACSIDTCLKQRIPWTFNTFFSHLQVSAFHSNQPGIYTGVRNLTYRDRRARAFRYGGSSWGLKSRIGKRAASHQSGGEDIFFHQIANKALYPTILDDDLDLKVLFGLGGHRHLQHTPNFEILVQFLETIGIALLTGWNDRKAHMTGIGMQAILIHSDIIGDWREYFDQPTISVESLFELAVGVSPANSSLPLLNYSKQRSSRLRAMKLNKELTGRAVVPVHLFLRPTTIQARNGKYYTTETFRWRVSCTLEGGVVSADGLQLREMPGVDVSAKSFKAELELIRSEEPHIDNLACIPATATNSEHWPNASRFLVRITLLDTAQSFYLRFDTVLSDTVRMMKVESWFQYVTGEDVDFNSKYHWNIFRETPQQLVKIFDEEHFSHLDRTKTTSSDLDRRRSSGMSSRFLRNSWSRYSVFAQRRVISTDAIADSILSYWLQPLF